VCSPGCYDIPVNRLTQRIGHTISRAGRLLIRIGNATKNEPVASSREARAKVQRRSLLHYAADVYSQRGDDGIIREILRRLDINRGYFIEFGASDGLLHSNTRLLFEDGWSGMFIEGDDKRARKMIKRYARFPDIVCIRDFVYAASGPGRKTLDDFCDEHQVAEIDFLSIDIDGLDLNIFESLRRRPKVLAMEGGFSWHPQMKVRVPDEVAAKNLQQPLAVAIAAFQAKGYEPICFNTNLYAVEKSFAGQFRDFSKDAESLWLDAYYAQSEAFRSLVNNFRANNRLVREYEAPHRSGFTINV